MTDLIEDKPKPKTAKRRKIFRRLILCAVIAAVAFFVARVVRVWTGKPVIAVDYVAELNRLTKPQNYDPNDNAAPYYEQALAAYLDVDYIAELNRRAVPENYYSNPDSAYVFRRLNLDTWPADLSEDWFNELKKYIEANAESIRLLHRALGSPYYWVEYSPPKNGIWGVRMTDEAIYNRPLMRLFCLRARLKICEGRIEGAFDDVYDAYRMGLQLSGSPLLIRQLTGNRLEEEACKAALEILGRSELSGEWLRSIHDRFEELIAKSNSRLYLDTEKFGACDAAQRLFTDDGRGGGHLILPELYALERDLVWALDYGLVYDAGGDWIWDTFGIHIGGSRTDIRRRRTQLAMRGPGRRESLAEVQKYYAKLEDLDNSTPWELYHMGIESSDDVQQISDDNVFKEFLPNPAVITLKARTRGTKAALLTVLGILRYKEDTGELPESLDQLLAAGYIKKMPRDPYGPGSLVYRRNRKVRYTIEDEGWSTTEHSWLMGGLSGEGFWEDSTEFEVSEYKEVAHEFILYSCGPDFDDGLAADPYVSGPDRIYWPVENGQKL